MVEIEETMSKDDRISVLLMGDNPKNPYMELLKSSLKKRNGISVKGIDWPIILPLTRTAFSNSSADVMQLDWVFGYYMTDNFTSYKFLDDLITFSRAAFFLFDLLLVSFFSISIVWTVHNKQHHEKKYSKTEKLINEALFLVSDGVTVKCKSASGTLSKMYRNAKPSKMHVVPDGNYMGAYQNNVGREESREDLGITSDSFVYLYFGLIREYKGVPELISQFSELPYNDIELWVVGQPWNEKIERELSKFDEQVDDLQIVPKYIDDEDVQNYMNAADVLVLPYRDILNSGSAHLGLSFGVPVIAPKIGCIPAVFPKENKFLYDPDVKDSLKVQLEEVYNSTELKSVSSANYERALDQNWDETARKLEEVYQYSI